MRDGYNLVISMSGKAALARFMRAKLPKPEDDFSEAPSAPVRASN